MDLALASQALVNALETAAKRESRLVTKPREIESTKPYIDWREKSALLITVIFEDLLAEVDILWWDRKVDQ